MSPTRYPLYSTSNTSHTSSHTSSSAPPSTSTYTRRAPTRTPSPPASAYFAREFGDLDGPNASGPGGLGGAGGGGGLGGGGEREPQPINTDAREHFAYSTTLRRHHQDSHLGLNITPFDGFRDAASEEGIRGIWGRVRGMIPWGGEERGVYAVLPREEREGRREDREGAEGKGQRGTEGRAEEEGDAVGGVCGEVC